MKKITEIEINLEKLERNIQNLKGFLKPEIKFMAGKTEPGTLLMAVVKANAYGHGILEISREVIHAGADWLGVVTVSEAAELRDHNILKPILVLGYSSADDLHLAANKDISVAIISLEQAKIAAAINFDKTLKIHLKIDTGLNRLGLSLAEMTEVLRLLKSRQNIIIEGVYSHLASVEENDLTYAKIQVNNFKEAVKILKQKGYDNILKHIAASAATLVLKESQFDMVRCGIAIYGLWPSEEIKQTFNQPEFLEPVLSYKTHIVQIKNVKKGEKIGYGCAYETKENMTIGIIPVGYYDGIDRGLSAKGEVLISGRRCPVIGRVCMNMTIIDISNLKTQISKLNSEVVIIGKQGTEEITADEIAQKIGTINYEIVSRLPEHINRSYI